MAAADLGTIERDGDRAVLTFTRRYAHPPEEVWAAVTEPEHQAVWFPQQILGERRAGAPLWFVTSVDPDEGFDGEMVAYHPPRVMEMTWGASRLRIELHPEDGGTRMVLTEVLGDVGTAARNGAGWHECLDRLTAVVEDSTPLRWGARWHEVHPGYVDAFGPDGARLGAPEGWDADLPVDPYAPRLPRHPEH